MADILNKRNKIHHLDADTDEDMFPIFETDVDGSPRNNKRLLPRRNYCTISPHDPESEGAELETATAQKSRFAKIRQNTFGKSSDKAAKPVAGDNFAREGGLDGAGSSKVMTDPIEMMRDGLQVTIRVEIDQKNKQGVTKPYRFAVPALVYDPGDGALRDMHGLKA